MSDAERQRVEMLLKIRRREEQDARRAFDQVQGRGEFLRGRINELGQLLAAQNKAARQVMSAPGDEAAPAYRTALTQLRQAIGEQRALLRPLEDMLRKCRAELLEARNRRRAVETLRDRLAARHSARRQQLEAGHLDDTHAARLAAADEAGG